MPLVLRVPFLIYGYVLGALWFAFLLVLRLTIAVRVTGTQNLSADSNYIFCQWHESGPLSFQGWTPRLPAYLRQRPHAWLQHPALVYEAGCRASEAVWCATVGSRLDGA